jgi:hypothetical protein
VRAKLARGHLKSSEKGRWTTTSQSVADYLAAKVAQKGKPAHPRSSSKSGDGAPPAPRREQGSGKLGGYYKQLLKDYFLAVALRRRMGHRSRTFSRMVLAGQVACLAAMVLAAFPAVRAALSVTTTPEQAAVETWLAENVGDYKILQWFPPQPGEGGLVVRARYRYLDQRKPIHTERSFLVQEGRVTGQIFSE